MAVVASLAFNFGDHSSLFIDLDTDYINFISSLTLLFLFLGENFLHVGF